MGAKALFELGKFDETINVLVKATKIFIVLPPLLQQLQKDTKQSISEKMSPLIEDSLLSATTTKTKVSTNDCDDPKYANMPELETDNSDNEDDSDHSETEP